MPFGNAYFSLNLSAAPTRTLSFNTQVFGVTALGEEDAEVDYAFAQWAPSAKFQLRAGKVKSPFGLYTEVYDVGTLRTLLPAAPVGVRRPGAGLEVLPRWRRHREPGSSSPTPR